MILWTIQPVEVYNQILEKGYYSCVEQKSEFLEIESFKKAYDWYIQKMTLQVGNAPREVKYPVWAWYKRNGKHKKPDLRENGYAKTGTKMVCMEIEISDENVLLSDFDAWHFVLNDYYFSQAASEEEWDKEQDLFDFLPEIKQQEKKEQSWNFIFDVKKENYCELNEKLFIQATFWILYASQIRKVQFFTAR